MKRNFLYQITAAFRTPDYRPQIPQIPVLCVHCPQLDLLNPPPLEQNSWVRHWQQMPLHTETSHS